MNGVATGDFVAEHLGGDDALPGSQIQPNGVDLTVGTVFRTTGEAEFTSSGYSKPEREEIYPSYDGSYILCPGQFPIVYGEEISIPEGYVGRVYPRSRLMRCGLHLTSALWDQGYEGVGEGLLRVPDSITKVQLEDDLPIAQMVFIEAGRAEQYDGTHQGERITDRRHNLNFTITD